MSSHGKILITGINGFIGSHVAKILVKRGEKVAGLVRNDSNLENLRNIADKIELNTGDIRSASDLRKAFNGVDSVIHTAALVRYGKFTLFDYIATNLSGTMNVVHAALEQKVKRFVYTSSCETLRLTPEHRRALGAVTQSIREKSPSTLKDMMLDYGHSKYLAEEHVKASVGLGLPAVILNPTAVIGPGDVNLTTPNLFLLSYLKGRIPIYFETGFNVVDVRDVAEAHVAALDHGKIGERYILGSSNVMLSELFGTISTVSNRKPFAISIPYQLVRLLSRLVPYKKLQEVAASSEYPFFLESGKAERELLWKRQYDLRTTVRDAIRYHSEKGRI